MRPLSAIFRPGSRRDETDADSCSSPRSNPGDLQTANHSGTQKESTSGKIGCCKEDVRALRVAINACTTSAQEQRAGRSPPGRVRELLMDTSAKADRCQRWAEEIQRMLQAHEEEDIVAALLQANDDLQAVLTRWQTLQSLGIEWGDEGRDEVFASEVGDDVLQSVGAVDDTPAASREVSRQLAALREQNSRLREELSAAEARQKAALAAAAAAHAKDITRTKAMAMTKYKELMAQIKELEDSRQRLAELQRGVEDTAREAEDAAAAAAPGAGKGEQAASEGAAEEVERLTGELGRTKEHLREVQAQLDAAREEVQRLRGQANSLELKLMEATQEAAQADADTDAKLAAKDAEIAELQGRMHSMQDSLSAAEEFKARMDAAEKQVGTLKLELRKESLLRKKSYNQIREMMGNIRVLCRVRPGVVGDAGQSAPPALAVEVLDEFTVSVDDGRSTAAKKYEFDTCFAPSATQDDVYAETKALLQSALDGYNVCIFCYGQTGSGKTHTITGTPEAPGIIPRAMGDLFSSTDESVQVEVSCCMMELYQDTLLDLLNPGARDGTKLLIKRDQKGAVFVEGSETRAAGSAEDLSAAFTQGLEGRKVAATKMNSESSRSHLIFTIFLEVTNATVGTRASSKVTFVDLAGSERVARSGAINDKDRLDEARAINKSLSALGDVVAALTAGESFVPYRNHKLTQLMSDSLGGNAKTLMIVNVSPVEDDAPETKNSLEYANRVKQVKNENSRSFETREIQKLKAEIAKLKSRKASPQ